MSVGTNDSMSVADSDEFRPLSDLQNVKVKDKTCGVAYDSDESKYVNEISDLPSSTTREKTSDADTNSENHLHVFTIPVFERYKADETQRSLLCIPMQTHKEYSSTETDFISLLGLSSFVSSNITIQRAISEASLVSWNSGKHTDLPWAILQYILKHNLRWRDSKLPELQLQITNTTADQSDTGSEQVHTLEYILYTENSLDSVNQCAIHPLDIFVTTFSCCSNELKVIICQKLFMCKQAIPLIYPLPSRAKPCFTCLPLYSLVMECRTSENNADIIDAASAKTKIIGFLRIGSICKSKSSLLNGVINADNHAPFCHRDSLSSQTKPLSMEGLIEATWFLPSGKETDLFQEVMTFLNLRGDAQNIQSELSSFLFMCSTTVALVNVSNLTDQKIIDVLCKIQQSKNTVSVLLALIDQSDSSAYDKLGKAKQSLPATIISMPLVINFDTKGNLKPATTLQNDIRKVLRQVSEDNMKKQLIKCGRHLCKQDFVILDEDLNNDCKKGQKMAKDLFMKLCVRDAKPEDKLQVEEMSFGIERETCFSLQSKLWKDISELTKKQFKAGDSYEIKDRIKCDVESSRREQLYLCKQLKPAFEKFLQYLQRSSADVELCQSFIMWLRILLDASTRRILPDLFRKLRSEEMEENRARDKKLNEESIKDSDENLEFTTMWTDDASFGIEHFIRELGQLYECVMVSKKECGKKTLCGVSRIPNIVAKLLLKGEALEILDGNTANVPLQWIQSVFRCLKDDLGNRKLFIVSVLGLQSSGKSTLLNTMFGLQFKVSAGRCTKGVFAHLICLENQKHLPYEYMLVIDTEGLQGHVREKGKHDNELATFTIGMGDVTLINIKGENITELKDVLQIAVHAFLRMSLTNKSLKIKRKCIFIHQNVGDVHAKEKLTQSLKVFLDELDNMAQLAAREENIYNVESFKQVVDFQLQKHVLYFPDLWSGDPPMAPCNPGYSERVCEALNILHDSAKEIGSFMTITDLVSRIEDLWKGIMTEDFVFCFQNSKEINVYNNMDTEYHKIVGCFGQALMDWIENASYEMEKCTTIQAFTECEENLRQELNKIVPDKMEGVTKELIDYFDNSENRLTLEQWKDQRVLKFKEMAKELRTHFEEQFFRKREGRKLEIFQMEHQRSIIDKAKILATEMQGKQPTDREIENEFDCVWPRWMDELFIDQPSVSKEPIETTVYYCLYDRIRKNTRHLPKDVRELLSTPLDCTERRISWDDRLLRTVDLEENKRWRPSCLGTDNILQLRKKKEKVEKSIFAEVDVHFQNLLGKGIQFHKLLATQVIDKVLKHFEDNEKSLQFQFSARYQVNVLVNVCRFAVSQFKQMDIIYQEEHNERAKIEKYKKTVKSYFMNTVKREIAEVVAADIFCNCLKSSAVKTIRVSLPQKITHEIFALFGNRKQTLLHTLMEDLVQKKEYDLYSAYLNDPFTFTYSWIKNYVNKRIFKTSQDENSSNFMKFVLERLIPIIHSIKEGVDIATKHTMKAADTGSIIKDWVDFFQEQTSPYLKILPEVYDHVADQDVGEIRTFQKNVRDKLICLQQDIIEEFNETEFNNVSGKDGVNYENVFKTLWGCEAQCPFCGEPCYRSEGHLEENIKHSCIQHRPIGLSGTIYGENNKYLILESCSFQVQAAAAKFTCMSCSGKCKVLGNCYSASIVSHRFKDYQKYFPDWEIAPCTTMDKSVYWMWVFKTFKKDLETEHCAAVPTIPKSLISITCKEAMMSLQDGIHSK